MRIVSRSRGSALSTPSTEQLGWRDNTHALVLGVPTEQEEARATSVPGIYSIDVTTGDYERLASVSLDEDAWIRGIATAVRREHIRRSARPDRPCRSAGCVGAGRCAAVRRRNGRSGDLADPALARPCASAPGERMTAPDAVDFETFVAARAAALSRTAYLLTGNHHDAEDLVQATLFKAARAWHRIDGEPEPYVRRIMYNENVSRWRRRRVTEVTTPIVPERPTADASLDLDLDLDTKVALRIALQSLTPRQRTMVVLRFFEDLTEQRTAALMGVSVSTVKSETRRALARLGQLVPDLEPLPAGDG